MRYYFGGAYARRAELVAYADRIEAAGIGAEVHSRWLTQAQDDADTGYSVGDLVSDNAVRSAWRAAERDLIDLTGCDAIVSFTGAGDRGGRHVEHGVAIDLWIANFGSIRLIVVGPREHAFHCHPATEVFPDFDAFLKTEIDNYLNVPRR